MRRRHKGKALTSEQGNNSHRPSPQARSRSAQASNSAPGTSITKNGQVRNDSDCHRSGGGEMLKCISALGKFARHFPTRPKFGDLSRAPLALLRVELRGDQAECEWVARDADKWDADLAPVVAQQNASTQALIDAIRIRELLFRVCSSIESATLRAYRRVTGKPMELIVEGIVRRREKAPSAVRSLAMRAKLFGFRFWIEEEGILENLRAEDAIAAESAVGIWERA